MNIETQKNFIIRCLFIFILLTVFYLVIKFALPLLIPFIIGLVIAVCFRKPVDFLAAKLRIKRVPVAIAVLVIFYCLLAVAISLLGIKLTDFVSNLFNRLPEFYKSTFLPALQMLTNNLSEQFPEIEQYLNDFFRNTDQSLFAYISSISTKAVSTVTALVGQIPTLIINFIFTIVCSFFFTIDYYKITGFLFRQFNTRHQSVILSLKEKVLVSLGQFIKGYAIIILVTFAELSLGLWLNKIPNPVILGLLIALIDIMPIVGTGLILLPWSAGSFLLGNTGLGIGMLALYIVITVVRQILEPRIIGQNIGLHPIATLILMFIGTQLMGIWGLFLLPVLGTILVKLNQEGSIHLFKL